MVTFKLKISEPFTEQRVSALKGNFSFLLGVKTYPHSETQEKAEEYNNLLDIKRLVQLNKLTSDFLSDPSADIESVKQAELEARELSKIGSEAQTSWLKEQILFIKDFKIDIEEDGISKPIHIKDTRLEPSTGSPWETSEECLTVLLDIILEEDLLREPTLLAVKNAVFKEDYRDILAKNSKK